MALCLALNRPEDGLNFSCKIFKLKFFFELDIGHDILEGIVVLKLYVFVLGFAEKLVSIGLGVSKVLGNGLEFVVEGDDLAGLAVFELEGEKIEHFVRVRHVMGVVADVLQD
jgi:hypothetical protein